MNTVGGLSGDLSLDGLANLITVQFLEGVDALNLQRTHDDVPDHSNPNRFIKRTFATNTTAYQGW